MTDQIKTIREPITLDRFEYKLPENMYKVYKESSGFIYKLKHSKKEFDSEEKVLKFIEDTLKERKRYQQLVKTLSNTELKKLFSNVNLLGLSPAQIKEYDVIEQFQYRLVIDDEMWDSKVFKTTYEIKDYISNIFGLIFHGEYDLMSTTNQVISKGV